MHKLGVATSSLAVTLVCGCSSDTRPMSAMPEGGYEVTYSALSQDCTSSRGILLPPHVVFSPPDSAETWQTNETFVTLEASRFDDRIQVKIWSQSPQGSLFIQGDVFARDADELSGLLMIDAYAGQTRTGTPFCSATASVLMTPDQRTR